MKRMIMLASMATLMTWGQSVLASDTLTTEKDKVSYALGYEMGANFHREKIDVDNDLVVQGLREGIQGGQSKLSDKVMQETLIAFQKKLIMKKQSEMNALANKNAEEGKKFLDDNKTKPGVVTLADGLQYKILEAGTGASPKPTDIVKVEYEGKSISGEVFDSSYQRGKPVSFEVNGVIPAWTEALQKMKVGATWMVYAPPSLAYGKLGIGGPIGPEQTLVFKIHLLSIEAPKAASK